MVATTHMTANDGLPTFGTVEESGRRVTTTVAPSAAVTPVTVHLPADCTPSRRVTTTINTNHSGRRRRTGDSLERESSGQSTVSLVATVETQHTPSPWTPTNVMAEDGVATVRSVSTDTRDDM